MNESYRNIIVDDIHVALARQITKTLAPIGGKGMYTTGLSADGTAPATHWISSGFIDADYAALLPLDGAGGYPEMIVQMCADADFDVMLEDVVAVLDASDVTIEDPFAAMSRLGLQIVTQEESFL